MAISQSKANSHVRRNRRWVVWACLCSFFLAGCGEVVLMSDPKKIREKVSETELDSFLSIVDSLPNKKLPPMPSTLVPRPHWTQERTLPIQDLVRQENDAFYERWSVKWMARQLPNSKPLQRALRREQMTAEQFTGLMLAIGAALTVDALDERVDLKQVLEDGKKHVKELESNETAFSSLKQFRAYQILEQAAWITVVNRAGILADVPPENLTLVRKHRERLDEIFPDDLKQDPLVEFTNVMQERGIPFEEMAESGSDDRLEWNIDKALIGTLP